MKKSGWLLALVAALAMVIVPVTPSAAAAAGNATRQAIVDQAEGGNVGILSQAQVDALARSNPKLHAKLMAAYRSSTAPQLTPAEKKIVTTLTRKNLSAFKAGSPAVPVLAASGAVISTGAWLVIAFVAIIAILILWNLLTRGVARPAV